MVPRRIDPKHMHEKALHQQQEAMWTMKMIEAIAMYRQNKACASIFDQTSNFLVTQRQLSSTVPS